MIRKKIETTIIFKILNWHWMRWIVEKNNHKKIKFGWNIYNFSKGEMVCMVLLNV